jgi:hypothetical protein
MRGAFIAAILSMAAVSLVTEEGDQVKVKNEQDGVNQVRVHNASPLTP